MLHGVAFLNYIHQTGPRRWLALLDELDYAYGSTTSWPRHPDLEDDARFEPATISERRYPELFQVGETAYGRPLTDAQHPHDFFMELAASYDYIAGENTMLSFYAAPGWRSRNRATRISSRASAARIPLPR